MQYSDSSTYFSSDVELSKFHSICLWGEGISNSFIIHLKMKPLKKILEEKKTKISGTVLSRFWNFNNNKCLYLNLGHIFFLSIASHSTSWNILSLFFPLINWKIIDTCIIDSYFFEIIVWNIFKSTVVSAECDRICF